MKNALIIHGHFYQPPRENPWTGEVERELGAEPFHDWNDRIFHECYRANAFARIFDDRGHIERIVNNYLHISFNFGPTLLSWMERHHPVTYGRIDADAQSALQRGGHGNALAQGYNHTILPLCSERDRRTQVRWGVADFRYRFAREPEGLWLPETAANAATLDTLIEESIKFTILSPYQAYRFRPIGGDAWTVVGDAGIDTTVPYRYFHSDGSGRSIDLIFYDGHRSRAIAFENTLSSSQNFVSMLMNGGGEGRMTAVATDGESYGHHTSFGDRSLAHAMEVEAPERGLHLTNFAAFLAEHPPRHEAQVSSGPDGLGTAWSCAHGVGRWFRDCGCHTGGRQGWTQSWRGPLRDALNYLRDEASAMFEDEGSRLLRDPWAARDAFIDVLLNPLSARQTFVDEQAKRRLSTDNQVRVLSLLEVQHYAMLMFTSCGWFFSDVSGIETQQILKYADRVIGYMEELNGPSVMSGFLERLAEAKSNRPEKGTGADIFRGLSPYRVGPKRVAAHLAMSTLVERDEDTGVLAGYVFHQESTEERRIGRIAMCTCRLRLESAATGRTHDLAAAALHFGGVDFYSVVREHPGTEQFERAASRVWEHFPTSSLASLLRLTSESFGPDEYNLEHFLPDDRERISKLIFANLIHRFSEEYARLFNDNRRTLEMLQDAGFKLPKELKAAAEFTLGRLFEEEIRRQDLSPDPEAYQRAAEIAREAAEHGYQLDQSRSASIFEPMITNAVHVALRTRNKEDLSAAIALLELTRQLGMPVNVDHAQEATYEAAQRQDPDQIDRLLQLMSELRIGTQDSGH